MRLFWRSITLLAGLLLFAGIFAATQYIGLAQGSDNTCQAFIQDVYDQLETTCAGLERNEACLLSGPITTQGAGPPQRETEPGTVLDLNTSTTLQAGPITNADSAAWGVLTMKQGAGLPANTNEYVNALLFGEAELLDMRTEEQRNAPVTATCYGTVTTDILNVRSYPALDSTILGTAAQGETIIITGRLADTSWWRIAHGGVPAWVVSGFVRTNCQIIEVPVVLRDAPALLNENRYWDPYQIVALRSTSPEEDACPAAPPAGLLLQPPEIGRSRYVLNALEFNLTATTYLQANPEMGLLVQPLDAPLTVQMADGWHTEIPLGAQIRFPLSEDGLTVTRRAPGLEPLDVEALARLPLAELPHPIDALPAALVEIPMEETSFAGDLSPANGITLYFDNRAGIVHDLTLFSDAYPVLSVYDPDHPVLRPLPQQGNLSLEYWTFSNEPHLFELTAGTANSGSYEITTTTRDLRLCRPGGNRQSRTLSGGEDHAGNIWFGQEGAVVELRASGDVSESASSIPNWRLRITEMFLETPTLPPIQFEQIEGYDSTTITWTVPKTGYYWIEVWTAYRGTTTINTSCEQP